MYGLRVYNSEGQPLGWLYLTSNDTVLNYTNKYFKWCKQWKTEGGAKRSLEWWNKRWSFQSKGGCLQIELLPTKEKI